jgi:hypothetical protein
MSTKDVMRQAVQRHLFISLEQIESNQDVQLIIEQLQRDSLGLERYQLCYDTLLEAEHERLSNDNATHPDKYWENVRTITLECVLQTNECTSLDVSMEGFSGTLSKIADWIKRMIASMISGFKKLINFIMDDAAQMKFAIQDLRIKIQGVEGQQYTSSTVRLGRLGLALESSLGVPEDYRQLMRGVVELHNQLIHVKHAWVEPILSGVDQLNAPLTHALQNNISPHDLSALNARTISILHPDRLLGGFSRTSDVVDTRYERGTARIAPPLMGNRNIVVFTPSDLHHLTDAVDHAEIIQSVSASLTRIHSDDNTNPTELEMVTMSTDEILEVLRVTEEIIDLINGSSVQDIVNRIERIKSYVDAKVPTDISVKTQRESRAAISYAAAYVKWLKSPYVPLIGLADSTVRALMMLCNRHLQAYR